MNSKMMLPIELTKILYQNWQGQISVSSQDSQIYGKCLNGPGKVNFKNGNQYQGQFYNGLLHGKGKFIWSNKIQYEGQFTDNRITGSGIYKWPDGSVYQGEVKDGLRHGFGKYTIQDATYEGQWSEGKKQGHGKIIFKSGSIFEGEFANDLKHGYGKMYYYPSGNYFEGQWKNDKKQGKGTMNWTDIREKYVGEWKNNHQEGQGMHIWLENKGQGKYMRNRYEGGWLNGAREGYGVFYYANGSKYEGYWKDNMKQGHAFYTNQHGNVQYILFRKDRMIKNTEQSQIVQVQADGSKKVPLASQSNRKQVQANFYSLCLKVNSFYFPSTPNLSQLYNYLLRNNTNLKSWYKGVSTFYDQQSQFSFSLNLQGAWKMIRGLKILGNMSLAILNRGLQECVPKVKQILPLLNESKKNEKSYDSSVNVDYEDVYYRSQQTKNSFENVAQVDFGKLIQEMTRTYDQKQATDYCMPGIDEAFDTYKVHNPNKNILFREFIQLLVWIGFNLDPQIQKPHKSVQIIIQKISPFLENIAKMAKTGMNISQNMSDNKSSISKTEKNISPFFKEANHHLFEILTDEGSERFIKRHEATLKIREFVAYGRISKVFDDSDLSILEKIIDKYNDPEIISQEKADIWSTSTLSTKILNVQNYQMIEYQFSETLYILLVKKIGSHKQTDQNKKKYKDLIDQFATAKPIVQQERLKRLQYVQQRRIYSGVVSKKQKAKLVLQNRRKYLDDEKFKREERQREKEREQRERQRMLRQDIDIKDEDFEEQQSQFQI